MVKIDDNTNKKGMIDLKKKIKSGILLFVLLIIYVYVVAITYIPNSILLIQGEELNLATLWGIETKEISNSNPNIGQYQKGKIINTSASTDDENIQGIGKIELDLNLFGMIPVKNITVSVLPKTKVVALGNSIGLKLYTEGVLIVGKTEIEGKKPYENTGLEEGDRIISIDDKKITSTDELIEAVNSSQGKEIQIKYIGDEQQEETVNIIPAKTQENEYKLGLWVRDAAAGVGTLSFYIPETGMFGSLGHGITDIDTENLITISNGELVTTNIVSIQKGEKGKPGEIRGSIDGSSKIGDVSKNTNFGIFGTITNKNILNISNEEIDILNRNEIKIGKAQIICELEKGKKEYYDIEIQDVYVSNNKDNKSILIKVIDNRLLEKTGGIIQGMSGSPIIQNGKFVGAVTHVMVNDPTRGYRSICRYDA